MFLKAIDLTTALRPSFLPDEVLLFVQDNVGLYEGKYKLPKQQNGQVYLTSHRICYVDKADPRTNSLALDLKEVEQYQFNGRFLRSSPKITLLPKPTKRSSLQTRANAVSAAQSGVSPLGRSESPYRSASVEPSPASTATWVCTICSFSNPVPSNFDPTTASANTPLPPCLSCGIVPQLNHVLKAAISNAMKRPIGTSSPAPRSPIPHRPGPPAGSRPVSEDFSPAGSSPLGQVPPPPSDAGPDSEASFQCPRCTFLNHPSLLSCEVCGAPLISQDLPSGLAPGEGRTESPGPMLNHGNGVEMPDSVKVSFRGGGDKIFYERLKGAMTQRKWLLHGAPPMPKSQRAGDSGVGHTQSPAGTGPERVRTAGIAGLEQRRLDRQRNNEMVISGAFEDLKALMASAKEIVELAEQFQRQSGGLAGSSEANALLAESASQLGLVTTKDSVGGGSSSESLYLSELSRTLAEFLTDDARGILRRAGGIISLVDLWAIFNRARGGVELVSPMDFEKAARLWKKLKLPVRLRTFKSGVMVVQSKDRTDGSTVRALLAWLAALREVPPEREVPWDWREFGRGVTAPDVAERFGWSLGVAEAELEMAEERGVLCREESIEGLRFWENFIGTGDANALADPAKVQEQHIFKALKESGLI